MTLVMTLEEAELLAKLLESLCIIKGGQILHVAGQNVTVKHTNKTQQNKKDKTK